MMLRRSFSFTALLSILAALLLTTSCRQRESVVTIDDRLAKYAEVTLTADLSKLSENERKMIPILIDASKEMDAIFWQQAYGNKEELFARGLSDKERRYVEINYGPWDRLEDNEPFLPGFGKKPRGANFYPADLTEREFDAWIEEHPETAKQLTSLYTVVRRDAQGMLVAIPYHLAFPDRTKRTADLLEDAAELAEDAGLKHYLTLRAQALRADDYQESDMAWMDMKTNGLDVVIGPIETYEDKLYGAKAAHEGFVLIKDREWSDRLAKYAELLPALQRGLPVPEKYRAEEPGSNSDLNAYDVVYYAGDCNAGSKTIAINLPNDEEVQLAKGARRLQLKNAMRAKYDQILLPLSDVLIDESQRKHITFDAFFGNIMFHEVAHGLGIKLLIDGSGKTVREALKDESGAIEEGKADILGLFMIAKLYEQGILKKGSLEDHYVTFLAGTFRSVRFGASSAHGKANMLRFNFFEEKGVFTRDPKTGTYFCNFEKMGEAVAELTAIILKLQGDGDYDGAKELIERLGSMSERLEEDLARLSAGGIPVDITFRQGMSVLEETQEKTK